MIELLVTAIVILIMTFKIAIGGVNNETRRTRNDKDN